MKFVKPYQKQTDSSSLMVKVNYFGESQKDKEEALERALTKLKKLIQKDGLMQELKVRESFKSKGRKRYERRRQIEYKRYIALKKREKYRGRF